MGDTHPAPTTAADVPAPKSDIIVLGTSAGGLAALREIVQRLPADMRVSLFVVVHLAEDHRSSLAHILSRAGPLPIRPAVDGDPIEPGVVLVAPPDNHLLFTENAVRVERGPKVNGHRPSIDLTFRSAARAFGPRVIGVVLSGGLYDGADGLRAIVRNGGRAVIQDPEDAEYESMPMTALAAVKPERVLPAHEIGPALAEMALQEVPGGKEPSGGLRGWVEPSQFVCPECSGTLFEWEASGKPMFRCRVGHAYSEESLVLNKEGSLEAALWSAARALREQADLYDRLAQSMGIHRIRKRFEERAEQAREDNRIIERAIRRAQHASLGEDLDALDQARAAEINPRAGRQSTREGPRSA